MYDHGLVKQFNSTSRGKFVPINKTSSFTQDDAFVYAYFTAALYTANITWQWYDPSGQLYNERTTQVKCAVSPCTFVSSLTLAGSGIYPAPAAMRFGLWRLNVLADGNPLYSEAFSVNQVINEEDYWTFNVAQSAPTSVVHGHLTVTIHPDNRTWSSYRIYLPYATNFTSVESASNRTLTVSSFNASEPGNLVVNFGGARSDGYTFVLNFDLLYGVSSVNGWLGTGFSFTWLDEPYGRSAPFTYGHPIPESFKVTLPKESKFVDLVGINAMVINRNVTGEVQPSVSFRTTLGPRQRFGWALIYRDFTWANSHPQPVMVTMAGLPFAQRQPLPLLPLTLGGMSLWSGMMSVLLLVTSEALSPIYGRTGLLINRRRLRIAALFLIAIFVIATAYLLIISQQPLPPNTTR